MEWPCVIQTIIQRGEGRGRRTLGERASERECRGEAFAGWRSYVVHLMRCCCQTIITLIISSAVVTLGAHS